MLPQKYVGADQLIGGPWPDNNPGVSCLDWKSGQVNAKYWAIRMLANALGSGPKSLYNVSWARLGPPPPPYSPGLRGTGTCGVTFVCDTASCCDTQASGGFPWDGSITNISACMAKAKTCKMANFVSYSETAHDCSWYPLFVLSIVPAGSARLAYFDCAIIIQILALPLRSCSIFVRPL